jgi:TonB family protein
MGIAYYSYKDESKKEVTKIESTGESVEVVTVEGRQGTDSAATPAAQTPSAAPSSGVGQEIPVAEVSKAVEPKPVEIKPPEVKSLPAKKEAGQTMPTQKPEPTKPVVVMKPSKIKTVAVKPSASPQALANTPSEVTTSESFQEASEPSKIVEMKSEGAPMATSEAQNLDESPKDEITKENTNAPVIRLKPSSETNSSNSKNESKAATASPVNFDELDREVESEQTEGSNKAKPAPAVTAISPSVSESPSESKSSSGADSDSSSNSSAAASSGADSKSDSGTGTGSSSSSGSEGSGPIRTLSQILQMPNNPRPQYSKDERLQGQQGLVIFHAFISQDGIPQNFNLVKSTGFRNLDKKSLQALKEWRFKPGQEGWVELTFSWNLKGEPQPLSRPLRTGNSSVSSVQ